MEVSDITLYELTSTCKTLTETRNQAALIKQWLTRSMRRCEQKRAPEGALKVTTALTKLEVVSGLPVRGDVQPFTFFVFRHAQADEEIDDLVGDQ